MSKISLILPVYKQSNQVKILQELYTELASVNEAIGEVLIVANNNDIQSFEAFKKIESSLFKVYLLENGGWGGAIKFGVEKAQNDWVMYTNSARSHLEELNMFLSQVQYKESVFYKAKRQTRGLLRSTLSKMFELEFALFSGYFQTDVNGTPKLLSKNDFLTYNLEDDGVFFDSELSFKVRKSGHRFIDVPFNNYERLEGESTTNTKMAISFLLKLPGKIWSWK